MNKKILIVDDEQDMVEMLSIMLQQLECTILMAFTGERGIEIAKKELPDIIIFDLKLPGMDGIEFALKIKNSKKLKNAYLILMTASIENIGKKLKASGADDLVQKPFEPQELINKIKKIGTGTHF